MRRADRLFRIVEYLKTRRRAVTGQMIADEMETSVRTIYRDVADLMASGVPIYGEAGVGYMLDRDYLVQPIGFDLEELDALSLGARMVESWADAGLADAAKRALNKIGSVLPSELKEEMMGSVIYAVASSARPRIEVDFTAARRAIRGKRKIEFTYVREDGGVSTRVVRPLCLAFFAPSWLLTGWCEQRNDFRNFRMDRMSGLVVLDQRFIDEDGKRIEEYLRGVSEGC